MTGRRETGSPQTVETVPPTARRRGPGPGSSSGSRSGGVVYTPDYWADWAATEFDIHEKWTAGARILDPGCGSGSLTEALVRAALKAGYHPEAADLGRLNCIDTDRDALGVFRSRLENEYGLAVPEDMLTEGDFLLSGPKEKADVILGNPPWLTFADLDPAKKELYKPLFRSSGLTPDPRSLLLGGSRIDLCALFIITALDRWLSEEGEAFFFLPLSLYRSEGAHEAFRRLPLPGGSHAALTGIWELDGGAPFPGAGTRYGFARYRKGCRQSWPTDWRRARPGGEWEDLKASPVDGEGSPLVPVPAGTSPPELPRIPVPEGTRPRQGANPGGAAEVFIIEEMEQTGGGLAEISNRRGKSGLLPCDLLHPLMCTGNFRNVEKEPGTGEPVARRWIFLPYGRDGRILEKQELQDAPEAMEWLERHRTLLENRRGSLMGKWKEKGLWWALMGVGPYAFSPWKIAWEAYGRTSFNPLLFGNTAGGTWQGNQALHAYLPFDNRKDAEAALEILKGPEVSVYLESLGGAGTRTWAQPGRIRRLLQPTGTGNQKR